MNIKHMVVAILAIGISANAFAEEKKNEISAFVYANQQLDPSGQDPMLTVYASWGRYLTQRIALTVSGNVTGSNNFSQGSVGVGGKYYFKVGQKGDFVPFVTAELQVGGGGTDTADWTSYNIAAGGGASYFVGETTSIDGRIVYQLGSQTTTTTTQQAYLCGFGTAVCYRTVDVTSTSSTSAMLLTVGLTQRF